MIEWTTASGEIPARHRGATAKGGEWAHSDALAIALRAKTVKGFLAFSAMNPKLRDGCEESGMAVAERAWPPRRHYRCHAFAHNSGPRGTHLAPSH